MTANDPSLGYVSVGVNTQCPLNGDFDVQGDYRLLQWLPLPEVNVDFGTFSQATEASRGTACSSSTRAAWAPVSRGPVHW
jgi:hypothetical protein